MRGHLIAVILAVALIDIAIARLIRPELPRPDNVWPNIGGGRTDKIKGISLGELMDRDSPRSSKLGGAKLRPLVWKSPKVLDDPEEDPEMCDPDCDPEDRDCDDDDDDETAGNVYDRDGPTISG